MVAQKFVPLSRNFISVRDCEVSASESDVSSDTSSEATVRRRLSSLLSEDAGAGSNPQQLFGPSIVPAFNLAQSVENEVGRGPRRFSVVTLTPGNFAFGRDDMSMSPQITLNHQRRGLQFRAGGGGQGHCRRLRNFEPLDSIGGEAGASSSGEGEGIYDMV